MPFAENAPLPAAEYTSQAEDLCRQPDRCMDQVLRFANVSPRERPQWADRIQPRAPSVPPDVYRRYRRLQRRLKPYLEFHGYEADPA
jgi:hypothetical protein